MRIVFMNVLFISSGIEIINEKDFRMGKPLLLPLMIQSNESCIINFNLLFATLAPSVTPMSF